MKKTITIILIVAAFCFNAYAGPWISGSSTSSTDTIFDAAGDLIQGSGANAGERLAVGTAYQVLHSNGTKAAWTSTLGATGTRLTYGYFIDLVVTNAIQGSVTGNAGTATALAADPADCAEGQVATGIAASGALSCTATPSVTTLTGNVTGNCSGTAGGLSGTPNITVGTISAGATGFSVDADGDVTAKSYSTGSSTDPTINLSDSDNAAGTAKIFGNSGGGTNDIIMQLGVEDASGESTVYMELDGVTETVDLIKPVVLSSTLSGGGVILGDSTPDAAGELGYASNQLSVYDGTASRDLLQVASTVITKSEYIPIRYAEDDDSVTAPAAAAEIGTTTLIARSFAEDADNGVVIWWQIPIDYNAGIKFRVYFATDTNASANETAVFNLSGCAMASSGALACSEGTGQEAVLELTIDEDTGELLVTGWSAAITIGGSPAAGQMAKLLLIRDVAGGTTEDDMAGHALVTGIEIKYQAKVNASGDY